MIKKLCTLIGIVVLIAGLAVGGYFLYTNVLKDKIADVTNQPFAITYETKTIGSVEKVYVKGYTGSPIAEVEIPTDYQLGQKVYGISAEAFKNNKTLTTITIAGTVQDFGGNIFNGCDNLTTIIIKRQIEDLNFANTFNGVDFTKVTIKVATNDIKTYIETQCTETAGHVVVDASIIG